MKLTFQYIYLILAILLGLLTAAAAQLTNGDFASGLAGWTATGSVYPETYQSRTLASFNGNAAMDAPNDGVMTQTVPTVAGTSYSVTFNLGATGSALGPQRLQVGAEVFQIDKTQATQWQAKLYAFTATGAATTLVFKDVSAATNGIDLLLDDVVVTASVVAAVPPVSSPVVVPLIAACKLAWTAQAAGVAFRVFVDGAYRTTVPTNLATLDLATDALSRIEVDAVSPAGIASPRSAPLVVQPVVLECSADLKTWDRGAVFFTAASPRFFVRAKFITP